MLELYFDNACAYNVRVFLYYGIQCVIAKDIFEAQLNKLKISPLDFTLFIFLRN